MLTISRRQLGWTGAAVVVAMLGYAFYRQLEWEEVERHVGFSRQAIYEPFLAAADFLRQSGKQVVSKKGLFDFEANRRGDESIGAGDVLLLPDAYRTTSPRSAAALLEWVKEGGSLIYAMDSQLTIDKGKDQDSLLKLLNIKISISRIRHPVLLRSTRAADCMQVAKTADTYQRNGEALRLSLGKDIHFSEFQIHRTTARLGPDDRLQSLELPLGRGRIALLTSSLLWTNQMIGCFDHAYLLWSMTHDRERVWILENSDSPSLLQLLWQTTPWFIITALLSILLWLWRRAYRFGPIQEVKVEVRRRLRDHLRASGNFYWKHGQLERLSNRLTEETRLRIHRKYHSDDATPADLAQIVHRHTGLERRQLERALSGKTMDPVQLTRILQIIREKI